MAEETLTDGTKTVLVLLFILVIIVVALVYFYKRLNSETNGQYTIQRLLFAPGGLQDRLRQGVSFVETRLGVHIWSQPHDDEENVGDDVEANEELDKRKDGCGEEEEQQENDDDHNDSASDYSSFDLRERAKMNQEQNKSEKKEEEEKLKEEAAVGEEDESKEEKNEEKVELLVDLKPFKGSAIWSEENKDGNEGNDLTAL